MKILWRDEAQSAFKKAIKYIGDRNPSAALGISRAVRQQIALLSDHPHLGRAGRVESTRELVIAGTRYIVVYTVDTTADVVVVLHVLHGRQLWPDDSGEA